LSFADIPSHVNIASAVLDRRVKEGSGDNRALLFGEQVFTYRELSRMVNVCGNALLRSGLARGDRLLIRSTNCPEYLTTFLAALKIGCVPIPTNSLFRTWELEHILRNSGARAAFTTTELIEPLRAMRDRPDGLNTLVTFDGAADGASESFAKFVDGASSELHAVETSGVDLAFIIYTSGTTGEPKGVEHAHRWILATGRPITQHLMRLAPGDITFSPLEISFIYALGCNFLYPFLGGAAIAMTPGRFDPERTLAAIHRLRPTVLIAVPTLFRRLLALGDALGNYDLTSLRMGMSSGEPLPDDTLRSARERLGIEIYDCLGQTEIHIFMNPDPVKKLGSLGRPLDPHVVAILNDDGREAEVNEIGHLVIRADDPGLCLGYRDRPEIWSQTQKNGWYYTKDLAYRDGDGYFWYASRSDDLIKSRAYLISPREVESALMEHRAVLEAGVIGVPDEVIGQRICAYIIPRPGHEPCDALAADIAGEVRNKIALFKIPKEFVFVDSLPRTATGKLMRRELREQSMRSRRGGVSA
jgi:acyl-coenzyme A synthetase/AMP-(fatty) acid ligase